MWGMRLLSVGLGEGRLSQRAAILLALDHASIFLKQLRAFASPAAAHRSCLVRQIVLQLIVDLFRKSERQPEFLILQNFVLVTR